MATRGRRRSADASHFDVERHADPGGREGPVTLRVQDAHSGRLCGVRARPDRRARPGAAAHKRRRRQASRPAALRGCGRAVRIRRVAPTARSATPPTRSASAARSCIGGGCHARLTDAGIHAQHIRRVVIVVGPHVHDVPEAAPPVRDAARSIHIDPGCQEPRVEIDERP
jgi:hypothetical protein